MKKLNYIWFHKDRKHYFSNDYGPEYGWLEAHQGQPPIGLHLGMFVDNIEDLADDEQRKKWLPLARNLDIIGCYAQTEIGHGSDVQGLETTATFDKETDEFVIHTPSMTATKWWPGDMGRNANFGTVYARLLIENDGEMADYGPASFIVQLRDRDTHKHMPGVKSGDLGPKFGFFEKDNGWMSFNKVRIPRN